MGEAGSEIEGHAGGEGPTLVSYSVLSEKMRSFVTLVKERQPVWAVDGEAAGVVAAMPAVAASTNSEVLRAYPNLAPNVFGWAHILAGAHRVEKGVHLSRNMGADGLEHIERLPAREGDVGRVDQQGQFGFDEDVLRCEGIENLLLRGRRRGYEEPLGRHHRDVRNTVARTNRLCCAVLNAGQQ